MLNTTPIKKTNSTTRPLRILFASSEVHPLMKTGGLADVSANLPKALGELGLDVRIVMPAYYDTLEKAGPLKKVARLSVQSQEVIILETTLPETALKVWLVAALPFAGRRGDPYTGAYNKERPDNAQCFNLFCQVVSEIAVGLTVGNGKPSWQPAIVHCNDWQTGLVPVHLLQKPYAPPTLFTIHNLAYQGLFPYSTFLELGLDESLWRFDALEYYDQLSFIKGGITFSKWVNTVSPHYADEITTPDFGKGLDALLRYRRESFNGILNGIDPDEWNPANDKHIENNYDANTITRKKKNKSALQKSFGLTQAPHIPVFGWVGRLAKQKGIDLLIESLPALLKLPMQLVIIGSGDKDSEEALKRWSDHYPDKMAVFIGFDETIAHRIIASADFFLMPSRYEPCGLTQMYSLRYGTVPVASKVGGLVDTIVPLSTESVKQHASTGILFDIEADDSLSSSGADGSLPSAGADGSLPSAVDRALQLYENQALYQRIQLNAIRQDFSWHQSAEHYLEVYRRILQPDSSHQQQAISPL